MKKLFFKKKAVLLLVITLFASYFPVAAQIVNIGYKYQEKGMFQTSFNYPFLYDGSSHEWMLGIDYTSKNDKAPSGITPQITYGYYLKDNPNSDYFIMTGITAGYQFSLHKSYENQFKITPYVYGELIGIVNIKIGYDYMLPLQKGYPFVSVGIGGLHMFRHLRFM